MKTEFEKRDPERGKFLENNQQLIIRGSNEELAIQYPSYCVGLTLTCLANRGFKTYLSKVTFPERGERIMRQKKV